MRSVCPFNWHSTWPSIRWNYQLETQWTGNRATRQQQAHLSFAKRGKRGALLCIPWRPTEALYHHPLSAHSAMACFGRREGTFVCLSNQPSSRFTLFRLSGVHFPFLGSTTCYCQLVHCVALPLSSDHLMVAPKASLPVTVSYLFVPPFYCPYTDNE